MPQCDCFLNCMLALAPFKCCLALFTFLLIQLFRTCVAFFLHCPSASYQWNKLFGVFGERGLFVLWIFKSSYVLISKDLLVAKMPKALGCSQDVVLWCVWLERNGRIFSWQSSIEFIWDRVVSFASLCCYAHDLFSCVFFSS